jgi:uncharacterized CHY-type Zn-finger protein
MPAEAKCPYCQLKLRVPNDYGGKSVKCPQCQQRFIVGGGPALAQAQPEANARTMLKAPGAKSAGNFEDLVMSVLDEDEPETTTSTSADAHVQKVAGPSRFWRCPKCEAVWEKKPLKNPDLQGSRIKAMVRCETCAAAYDYQEVQAGKYDTPEISLTCPKCHVQLSGPAVDLLGKPCAACGTQLPKQ